MKPVNGRSIGVAVEKRPMCSGMLLVDAGASTRMPMFFVTREPLSMKTSSVAPVTKLGVNYPTTCVQVLSGTVAVVATDEVEALVPSDDSRNTT